MERAHRRNSNNAVTLLFAKKPGCGASGRIASRLISDRALTQPGGLRRQSNRRTGSHDIKAPRFQFTPCDRARHCASFLRGRERQPSGRHEAGRNARPESVSHDGCLQFESAPPQRRFTCRRTSRKGIRERALRSRRGLRKLGKSSSSRRSVAGPNNLD